MKIALVTWCDLPDLSPDDHPLCDELRRMGADVHAVVWSDASVRWDSFDAIVLRSTWDYHARIDEFHAWLDHLESIGAPAWNPPSLVRRNIHKRYLLELDVPVVPTILLPRGASMRVETRSVVKPEVSLNGHRTIVVDAGTEVTADVDLLVQAFVGEVVTKGEWSFVFLGGRFSHVVMKRAATGDFRVQTTYGGIAVAVTPPPALVDQAEHILTAIDEPWLYARVDAVEIDGRLVLMELEMTEPSLFFELCPEAATRMANAIHRTANAFSKISTIKAAPRPSGSCFGS